MENPAIKLLIDSKYKLMGYCLKLSKNRQDAEDLLQDTYLKILENIDKIDLNKLKINYYYEISLNTFIDNQRKKKLFIDDEFSNNDGFKYYNRQYHIDKEFELKAPKLLLQEMLNKLNIFSRQKKVLNYYINGFNHKEISKELNITKNTSKILYCRALKSARKDPNSRKLLKQYELLNN